MPKPARHFALRVLGFFSPLLVFMIAVEIALWKTGETLPIARVVARQKRESLTWMRGAFDQGIYPYKKQAFALRRPRIVALGSSRVMKFRAEMFGRESNEFFNCGGLVRSVSELEAFVSGLDESTTPSVVLLGVDQWWLNDARPDEMRDAADAALDWRAHLTAYRELLRKPHRGHGLLRDLRKALHTRHAREYCGIQARLTRAGFRSDGSKSSDEEEPRSSDDSNFSDERHLQQLRAGEDIYRSTDGLSPSRLQRLRLALAALQRKGALVLVFNPPQAGQFARLVDELPAQRRLWREYRRAIPQLCAQLKIPFCDASTPQALGLTDASMSDAIHAEETLHLYVLRAWLKDARVQKALPDASRVVEAAIKSPKTGVWFPDYGAANVPTSTQPGGQPRTLPPKT